MALIRFAVLQLVDCFPPLRTLVLITIIVLSSSGTVKNDMFGQRWQIGERYLIISNANGMK